MRLAFIVLAVLLLLCLLPLIVALGAGLLAGPLGCDTIAAAFRNCTLLGADVSDALTTAVALHWLGLLTLPCAALIVALMALLGAVQLLRRLRR
ncbi:hypothetical protein [Paragemmobacter ruber]|uniref:Uncharacterized protein n=1 Tax=Paragemmobacter ruber TaxID=1985673 RepID=A0ABW9Y184_9RHOB|nr:hypothetical protein [Rhodobacter ruber]NBE06271.1 hypothetical protein [Rhodobacter ruber]